MTPSATLSPLRNLSAERPASVLLDLDERTFNGQSIPVECLPTDPAKHFYCADCASFAVRHCMLCCCCCCGGCCCCCCCCCCSTIVAAVAAAAAAAVAAAASALLLLYCFSTAATAAAAAGTAAATGLVPRSVLVCEYSTTNINSRRCNWAIRL